MCRFRRSLCFTMKDGGSPRQREAAGEHRRIGRSLARTTKMECPMPTLPEHGPRGPRDDPSTRVVMATYAAFGAILAVLVGTVLWPQIAALAATVVPVIGAMLGAAAGVAALALRQR